MEPTSPWSSDRLYSNPNEQNGTQKRPAVGHSPGSGKRYQDKDFIAALDTIETANIKIEVVTMDISNSSSPAEEITEDKLTNINAHQQGITDRPTGWRKEAEERNQIEQRQPGDFPIAKPSLIQDTPASNSMEAEGVESVDSPKNSDSSEASSRNTHKTTVPETPIPEELIQTLNSQADGMPIDMYDTGKIIVTVSSSSPPLAASFNPPHAGIKRGTAIVLIVLLAIIALQGLTIGPTQFLGAQGWASVLGNPATQGNPNLLTNLKKQITHPVKPGSTAFVKVQMTPDQYIDLIVNKMTLDQKLGQMMIVQFTGATYDLPISTMISQYNVGAVLVFTANGNVVDKGQLTGLIQQMKSGSSTIPLAVAIDQEGGPVDRLVNLDGPRPSAATLGATNDPNQARQAGIQTANDLTSYGFNLNLAPVVDVTNVYNAQMDGRTFGDTPAQVIKMAGAYLQGLQKSGKVIGNA